MKVQSISPYEVGLPANPPLTSEKPVQGRGASESHEITADVAHEAAKQKKAVEVQAPRVLVNGQGLSLRFKTDDVTGIRVIEVVDRESGDVVRQIPPEEVVDFIRSIEENKGNFISRRL